MRMINKSTMMKKKMMKRISLMMGQILENLAKIRHRWKS